MLTPNCQASTAWHPLTDLRFDGLSLSDIPERTLLDGVTDTTRWYYPVGYIYQDYNGVTNGLPSYVTEDWVEAPVIKTKAKLFVNIGNF